MSYQFEATLETKMISELVAQGYEQVKILLRSTSSVISGHKSIGLIKISLKESHLQT